MNANTIGGLIVASIAVLGSIGSTLLLAYRVGIMTGEIRTRVDGSEKDRINLWAALALQVERFNRHLDERHQSRKGNPS